MYWKFIFILVISVAGISAGGEHNHLEQQLMADSHLLRESQFGLENDIKQLKRGFDILSREINDVKSDLLETDNPVEKCKLENLSTTTENKLKQIASQLQLMINVNDADQMAKFKQISQNLGEQCENDPLMEMKLKIQEKLSQFDKFSERLQNLETALQQSVSTAEDNERRANISKLLTESVERLQEQEQKLQYFDNVVLQLLTLAEEIKAKAEKNSDCETGKCLSRKILDAIKK
ncbi:uncharacterized protein LOC101888063 [Musca domestica]|uniref:Vacuolar protein-sorting-associated protein 46-like n=1 Tax=Musca domestica TaxID=7370 RepID=A0A1I8MI75_MUSDO|nr:uncharacterized protein LOC101888063 [Musca domestica]